MVWLSLLVLAAIVGGIVFFIKKHQRTQAEQEAQSAIIAAELLASARKANQADEEASEVDTTDLAAPDLLDIPNPTQPNTHRQQKSHKKGKKGKHTPQPKAAPKIVTPAMVPKITPAAPEAKAPVNTSETILVLDELRSSKIAVVEDQEIDDFQALFRAQNKKQTETESSTTDTQKSDLELDLENALDTPAPMQQESPEAATDSNEQALEFSVAPPPIQEDPNLEFSLEFDSPKTSEEPLTPTEQTLATEDNSLNFEFSLDLESPSTNEAIEAQETPSEIATFETQAEEQPLEAASNLSLNTEDKPSISLEAEVLAFEAPSEPDFKLGAGEDILLTESSLVLDASDDLSLDLSNATEEITLDLSNNTSEGNLAFEMPLVEESVDTNDDFELLLASEPTQVAPVNKEKAPIDLAPPQEATPEAPKPSLKVVVTPKPQAEEPAPIPQTTIALTPPADAVGFSNVAALSQAPTEAEAGNKNKIMIVDDSKVVRIKTSRVLTAAGFEVVTAEDGMDALRHIKENGLPDVMITDIEMPVLDGMKLTEIIRRHPKTSNLPIVMITSHTEAHKAQAAMLNVNVFLSKPYADADLVQHIQTLAKQPA